MITKKKKNNQLFCARGGASLAAEERGAAKPRGRGLGRRKKEKMKLNIYN